MPIGCIWRFSGYSFFQPLCVPAVGRQRATPIGPDYNDNEWGMRVASLFSMHNETNGPCWERKIDRRRMDAKKSQVEEKTKKNKDRKRKTFPSWGVMPKPSRSSSYTHTHTLRSAVVDGSVSVIFIYMSKKTAAEAASQSRLTSWRWVTLPTNPLPANSAWLSPPCWVASIAVLFVPVPRNE